MRGWQFEGCAEEWEDCRSFGSWELEAAQEEGNGRLGLEEEEEGFKYFDLARIWVEKEF